MDKRLGECVKLFSKKAGNVTEVELGVILTPAALELDVEKLYFFNYVNRTESGDSLTMNDYPPLSLGVNSYHSLQNQFTNRCCVIKE